MILLKKISALARELPARLRRRWPATLFAADQLRKFSAAIEQSPSTIVITNLRAEIEYVNPAFTRSTGYMPAEVIGQNPRILKSHLTPPETYAGMWAALSAGRVWRGELINRRKNGEVYWEYTVIAPIRNAWGAITHYVAIKEDITARKAAEQMLIEIEKPYHDLFELESDAIFIIRNSDGAILEANSAATSLYGFGRAELAQMRNVDLSAEPQATQQFIRTPAPADQVVSVPLRWHRKKDGTVFPIEVTARFIEWQGESVHIAAIRDISERQRAADEERRFAQMLTNLSQVTMELSLATTFDEMCRLAIELGREKLNFDRLGLWFIDLDAPEYMIGSFGVDENGQIRDERQSRAPTTPQSINQALMANRRYIYHATDAPVYDGEFHQVGHGEKAAVGLWDGNTVIGFLYTDNFLKHQPIDEHQRELLMLFAQVIGHQGTIKRAQQKLELLATTDPLTGLLNRRSFFIEAEKIFARSNYPTADLVVMMLDIDHFKQVNDTHGHLAGDVILREVTRRVRDNLRPTDLLGRYGGEEFVALLPRMQRAAARQAADRLLTAIRAEPIQTKDQPLKITISLGVASLNETVGNLDQLLSLADQALYQAKNSGRNQWVFAADQPEPP